VIKIPIANNEQQLIITDDVLRHFDRYRQVTPEDLEAGGQLFAQIVDRKIIVLKATGPTRLDIRHRINFSPNSILERITIRIMFWRGFYYVGDWHTHPEPYPSPSPEDIHSFSETFTKSRHQLAGMLMIIVGQRNSMDSLYLAIQDERGITRLDI